MDRRVVRTKKVIRDSFVELLGEKDFDKITVKEIADRANVDRKTVYNYYTSVSDILDELENELARDFEDTMGEFTFESIENAMAAFAALNEHLKRNMELYNLVMRLDGKSRLLIKTIAYLKRKIRSVLSNTSVEGSKIDLGVEYVTSGMFMAYRYWFNSDRKQSLEEFSGDVAKIVIGGVPAYLLDLN